jgi:hypothetical protein
MNRSLDHPPNFIPLSGVASETRCAWPALFGGIQSLTVAASMPTDLRVSRWNRRPRATTAPSLCSICLMPSVLLISVA